MLRQVLYPLLPVGVTARHILLFRHDQRSRTIEACDISEIHDILSTKANPRTLILMLLIMSMNIAAVVVFTVATFATSESTATPHLEARSTGSSPHVWRGRQDTDWGQWRRIFGTIEIPGRAAQP